MPPIIDPARTGQPESAALGQPGDSPGFLGVCTHDNREHVPVLTGDMGAELGLRTRVTGVLTAGLCRPESLNS
jgi:hypothetical protein